MLDNPVCLVFFLVFFILLPLLLTAEFWRGILYSISNFLVNLEMKNTTTCLNVVIDVSQGNNWLLLKVIFHYLTVYAKATFNTNLSMSVTALAAYWYPSCFFGAVFSSSACLQYSLILERSVSDFPATRRFSSHLLKPCKRDWSISK